MLKLERVQQIVRRMGNNKPFVAPEPANPGASNVPDGSLLDINSAEDISGEGIVLAGVDERLATTRFRVDSQPHIQVNNAVCKECSTQACVYVCPANLFTPLSDGTILFNYEQCFECGTCYVACNREGAITWTYPRGGFGVSFREA